MCWSDTRGTGWTWEGQHESADSQIPEELDRLRTAASMDVRTLGFTTNLSDTRKGMVPGSPAWMYSYSDEQETAWSWVC